MRVPALIPIGLLAVLGVAVSVIGATIVIVIGFRRRDPRVLGRLVRWQRERANPMVMRTAGRPGDRHSVIRHVGRSTGREYATPISAVPAESGFEVVLPYGAGTQWVRNVLAGGTAVLEHDGRRHEVIAAEVVPLGSTAVGQDGSFVARVFGVREALRLSTSERMPPAAPDSISDS
jgi:hypothetical protein